MCKGREEERSQPGFCGSEHQGSVSCELCGSRASLYCQADHAFICRKCDKWVHGANFLAQRHIRCFLCNACQNLTERCLVGSSHEMALPTLMNLMDRRKNDPKIKIKCSKMLRKPFLSL